MSKFMRLLFVIVAVICGGESISNGQIPRYSSPSGPALPNQLNYFKRDTGLLDPYNSIVGPQQQINRQFQQQGQQNIQLQQQLTKSQSELEQIRDSEANVTGAGAGFMNNSRYFMNSSGGGNAKRGTPKKYTFSKSPRANAQQANTGATGTGS